MRSTSVLPVMALVGIWMSMSAGTYADEILYVANNKDGTISVIDVSRLEVVRSFDVVPDRDNLVHADLEYARSDKLADDVVTSPDGTLLYVSRPAARDVAAFDTRTYEMAWRFPTRGIPDHFALSADGTRLFVSIISDQFVEVIDVENRQSTGGFRTSRIPHGMTVSPSGRFAVNGTIGGRRLTIADAHSLEVVRRIEFEEGVRPFVIPRSEERIYVQLSRLHGFVEVDFDTGRVEKTVHLPVPDGVTAQRSYPHTAHHGLALTSGEEYMCAAGTVADYVAVLSYPALSLEAVIPVGAEPSWITAGLDGRYCYVSNRASDEVSVISVAEMREVKRIRVGEYPQRMSVARRPDPR